MNLTVTVEQRFDRTPDGAVWTQAAFAYPFWTRYLDEFDTVRPCARVQDVPAVPPDWVRADGPGVAFAPVPHYLGPLEYARKRAAVRRAVRAAVTAPGAVILRVPSQLAVPARAALRGRPYAVEVVGDPYDVFAPGAVRHPLRPFFRWSFARSLRAQCAGAVAAAYVTREMLQRRYPPAPGAFTTHYSSVELPDAAFVPAPRPPRPAGPFTVVTVGSLAQLYKAPDVLIEAAARCVQAGLDVRLVLVGDGRHRPELEALAAARGLAARVTFTGQLTAGDAVRARLDQADLFALPSRTEGLPRALIEAMARGLPCIGSAVGGIPELLPPEDMVPPGDAPALAALMAAVLRDPDRRACMAARSLETARAYHEDILRQRRTAFYHEVKARTSPSPWERGPGGEVSSAGPGGEVSSRGPGGEVSSRGPGDAV
jgi:glycosyltransferase involved in cell wall biosynthesis